MIKPTAVEENDPMFENSLWKEGRKPCVKFVKMSMLITEEQVI